MKEFLLLFTIIELMVLISGVPDRCGNGVKHPYPGDNTKFIICENHIPLAKKCPVGTTFNQNVQVCDSLGNSDTGNLDIVIGTSRTANYRPVQTTHRWIGQNGGSYSSSANNAFEGNSLDQNIGTGHSNQHLSVSKPDQGYSQGQYDSQQSTIRTQSGYSDNNQHLSGSKPDQGYSQGQYNNQQSTTRTQSGYNGNNQHLSASKPDQGYSQGQYNNQQSSSRTQSGYSGLTVPNNNLGYNGVSYGQNTNLDNGLGSSSNHYSGTSNIGHHVVTSGQSTDTLLASGYDGAVSGPVYASQGYDSKYGSHSKTTGIKTHHQHSNSDFGGNYNDHKNINSDNGLWLQNQNHGLDQNHINLNEIRGSTGHSANSCNKVAPGEHISYPGDCTKFVVCMQDGNNVVKDCPPKTHFNAQLQICDWPESAGCAY